MSVVRQIPDDVTTTLAFGVAPSKTNESGVLHALRRDKPPRNWVARCGIPMNNDGREPFPKRLALEYDAGDRTRVCNNCADAIDEIALIGAHIEKKPGGNAYMVFEDSELFAAVHCPNDD